MSDPFLSILWRKRLASAGRRFMTSVTRPLRPGRIDPGRSGPPNLLVVGIDTLRGDYPGISGRSPSPTPALDELAAGGTYFSDVSAPAPWTLPSFTSSLTGVMPALHGAALPGDIRNMDTQPPHDLRAATPTLASHLGKLGYRTAAFYANQFFEFGLADTFEDHEYHNLPAENIVGLALEWIRRHADRPFFCFLLLNDPHEPTTPAGEFLAPHLDRLRQAGISADDARLQALVRWGDPKSGVADLGRLTQEPSESESEDLAVKLALYEAAASQADAAVGDLWRRMQRWDLADTTLMTVFADHGEEFLEHAADARLRNTDPRSVRGVGHGHSLFQELLHVPWLACGAAVPAGVRCETPVSLCDVSPTLCDWLGVEAMPTPRTEHPDLTGRSVAGSAPQNRVLFAEEMAYGPDLVMVRRDGWKLVALRDKSSRSARPIAMYDLASDPGEQTDRLADEPTLAAELNALLQEWIAAAPADDREAAASWQDLDDEVVRRLKDLGYAD